jgi:RNase P/RNase MRP subunit POP5
MEIKIEYMTKLSSTGIVQTQETLSMDREVLDLYLDLAMTSLYGKVGSAPLQYQVKDYSRKQCTLTLLTNSESCWKVWTALAVSQATMDGIHAVRFNLRNICWSE